MASTVSASVSTALRSRLMRSRRSILSSSIVHKLVVEALYRFLESTLPNGPEPLGFRGGSDTVSILFEEFLIRFSGQLPGRCSVKVRRAITRVEG
jgi:hypothetical protein